MSTTDNQVRYDRSELGDASDLTEAEWSRVERLILPARRGGRKREATIGKAVGRVMSILSTGRR